MREYFRVSAIFILCFFVSSCAMKFSSVTKEEREAYEKVLERKRMNFYFDNVAEVTSTGYRILQEQENGADTVIPILFAETGEAIREMFPGVPRESILVVGVLEGLAPAGLRVRRGDILETLEGNAVRSEPDLEAFMKEHSEKEKIRAVFSRNGGERWEEELPLVRVVKKIRFIVDGRTSEVAAYTDGKETVAVSTQMLRFAADEEELAFIVAHELGHIFEGHRLKIYTDKPAPVTAAASLGSLIDQLAPGIGSSAGSLIHSLASAPYSQKMELEADLYAARRMAELGYDPAAAYRFMKRFAVELPATQKKNMLSTHPTSSERMAALEKFGKNS